MRFFFVWMVAVFPLLSFAQTSACDGFSAYPVTHGGDFLLSYQRYLANGGLPEGIVLVNQPAVLLTAFKPMKLPIGFSYNKRTRAAMAYKFAVSGSCELRISRYEYGQKEKPQFNVHHHLTANGNEAYTAGAIFIFHNGEEIEKVIVGNRSSQFCPAFSSLEIINTILGQLGVPADRIELLDEPNDSCGEEL